jgi:hypothetical protein
MRALRCVSNGLTNSAHTLDKLDVYITNCDAVVHLVGDMTGPPAKNRPALGGSNVVFGKSVGCRTLRFMESIFKFSHVRDVARTSSVKHLRPAVGIRVAVSH